MTLDRDSSLRSTYFCGQNYFVASPVDIAHESDSLDNVGYWPESESFHDRQMSPAPTRWKGACVAGENFTADLCNK